MISLVMPTFNEMQHGYIQKSLPLYQGLKVEIIIVDGDSKDGTQEFLKDNNIQYTILSKSTRLKRIQKGLTLATDEKIIIHHPRSILDIEAFEQLERNSYKWGAFTHKFDMNHPLLRFTSFYSNQIRGDFRSIFYLDHCFFFKNEFKNLILELEDYEIFEDTEMSKALKRIGKAKRLSPTSLTSAIRFKKNGIYKQALLNQKMKLMYYLKKDHIKMNKEYEKNLNLNNESK